MRITRRQLRKLIEYRLRDYAIIMHHNKRVDEINVPGAMDRPAVRTYKVTAPAGSLTLNTSLAGGRIIVEFVSGKDPIRVLRAGNSTPIDWPGGTHEIMVSSQRTR